MFKSLHVVDVVISFVSMDVIFKCDHSSESYLAGAVYYAVQGGSTF